MKSHLSFTSTGQAIILFCFPDLKRPAVDLQVFTASHPFTLEHSVSSVFSPIITNCEHCILTNYSCTISLKKSYKCYNQGN